VRFCAGRIEVDSFLHRLDGCGEVAAVREDLAESQLGFRFSWRKPGGCAEFFDCFVEIRFLAEALRALVFVPDIEPEVVVRLGILGFGAGNFAEQYDRAVEVAELGADRA
jgi:hypothetical protein